MWFSFFLTLAISGNFSQQLHGFPQFKPDISPTFAEFSELGHFFEIKGHKSKEK